MVRMLRLAVATLALLTLDSRPTLAGNSSAPLQGTVSPSEFTLAGLHAHLFYEPLAQLDERDLVAQEMALWNTIIGEGDAKAPSRTTIVVVDVVGPSFQSGTKGTLTLTARNKMGLLRKETVQLQSFFSEGTKLSIPFVVVGTGCGSVTIDVALTARGKSSKLRRTVEYPCGE